MSGIEPLYTDWIASNKITVRYHIYDAAKPMICFIPGDVLGNNQLQRFFTEIANDFNLISIDYQLVDWNNNLHAAKEIANALKEYCHHFQVEMHTFKYLSFSRGSHIFFLMLQHNFISTNDTAIVIAPLLKLEKSRNKTVDLRLKLDVASKFLFNRRFKLSYPVFCRRFLNKLEISELEKRAFYRNSIPLNRSLILDKTVPNFNKITLCSLNILLFEDDVCSVEQYQEDLKILSKTVDFQIETLYLSGVHINLDFEPKKIAICLKRIFKSSHVK